MKMDDSVENEIIGDIFSAHLQICKRYFTLLYVNIFNISILAPGETLQSKLMRPAPFMILMLILILISIVIQSNHHLRNYIFNFQSALTPAAGITFGNLSDTSGLPSLGSIGGETLVVEELQEGLVGIYAMQGRRGNMEDRFCVLQDVVVGPNKTMSFFGVYDGHGGQFVAEYLRVHLFKNTVEKIKQLRSAMQTNGIVDNRKATAVLEKKMSVKKTAEKKLTIVVEPDKSNGDISGDKVTKDETNENIKQSVDKTLPNGVDHDKRTSDSCSNEPLKKDDAYNTLNIRKKSIANINANVEKVEKVSEDVDDTQQYVDMNKNINYTKLLTDQILNIDSQVVEQCKTNTDLSGSTAVVAVLDGELLVVGNVGDSRAVMADDRGRAIPLSFDHKPNQLKERRRIKEAGGFITFTGVWRVAGILATSRALGDFPLKQPRPLVTAEPDILTFSLHDHKAEFVILATDGLWDVLTNEEAVSYVRSHLHEADFGAKSVARHAYAIGSQDNITVAVINFTKMKKDRKR